MHAAAESNSGPIRRKSLPGVHETMRALIEAGELRAGDVETCGPHTVGELMTRWRPSTRLRELARRLNVAQATTVVGRS